MAAFLEHQYYLTLNSTLADRINTSESCYLSMMLLKLL